MVLIPGMGVREAWPPGTLKVVVGPRLACIQVTPLRNVLSAKVNDSVMVFIYSAQDVALLEGVALLE